MAYQTGVSGSVNDFMTALLGFASANGFTTDATWTNGGFTYVTLLKNGIYFVFAYNTTQLLVNTATSILGSGTATAQPGAAGASLLINPITGPHISYHFFSDGEVCNAVAEVATNVFSHLNFGFITKNGSWTGGAFVTGTNTTTSTGSGNKSLLSGFNIIPYNSVTISTSGNMPSGRAHLRSDVISAGGISGFGSDITGSNNSSFNKAWLSDGGGRPLVQASPNTFNGRSVIVPITIIQASIGTSGPYYQLGHVPNAGVINIATIEPKAIINTDWMVFPVGQKGSSGGGYIESGNYAMAYKQ